MPDQALIEQQQDAKLLVPEYTYDDFCEEAPYKWLYQFKDNQFTLNQMLAKVGRRAREVKFPNFNRMWNSYVAEQKPSQASIIGEYDTAFPNQPKVLHCRQYICDEYGIAYIGQMGQGVEVLSHPLMPIKRVINLDSGDEKLEIIFSRGGSGEWRSLIVSKEVLASSQRIIALAKQGVGVNSENAKELVNYITKIEASNYNDIDVESSTGHLGWLPDGQFSPYCEGVVYDGDSPEFQRMFASFKETGSEETWMNLALAVRAGESVPARIALAASFAAPLIKLCNGLPYFVHLWGTQGCGKTVGLMLAASVWGNPEVGQYIKTFAGTKVSQEIYASFCGNVPILLDELQIISDRKSFDDIIYTLCEGSSKGRGTRDGGLQLQRRWASTIITTAEMPIVQSNSGGGAAARTIEVNYGGQPLFPDSRAVAETLKQNYGWAGRKYIAALKEKETVEALRSIQKAYHNQLAGDIQEKQVLAASILLAADKLADIAIFHDGHALTVDDIRPYLITNEQADVNARAYNWLIGFIGGNPRRFDAGDGNNGELWGVVENGVCYFNRTFFDRAMQAEGYSASSFLTWATRNGKIIRHDYGKGNSNNRMTVRKKVGDSQVSCVALCLPTDAEEPQHALESPQGFTAVEPDDLPF